MEAENTAKQPENSNPHKNKVHKILAHAYLFYFVLFLIGLLMDSIFSFKIFKDSSFSWMGIILLVLGTFLVLWAQNSSNKLQKENISVKTFYNGPYKYTRNPTYLGLFLLTLGFGIIADAFFLVFFSIIYFLVVKFIFIKKEENILTLKYGDPYLEYKKLVKF